jgi:hypothetical protein
MKKLIFWLLQAALAACNNQKISFFSYFSESWRNFNPTSRH